MAINTYDESFLEVLKNNAKLVITVILGISLIIIAFFGIRWYVDSNSQPGGTVDSSGLIRDYNVTIGNKDSNIKILYAFDLQCPACKQNQETMTALKAELKDKVLFVYKNHPLPIHSQAKIAAYATLAAGEQDKYFEFIDQIYVLQEQLKSSTYDDIAKSLNLDMGKWNDARNSTRIRNYVETDLDDLKDFNLPASSYDTGNRVSATPTTLLIKDDKVVEWWSGDLGTQEALDRINKIL